MYHLSIKIRREFHTQRFLETTSVIPPKPKYFNSKLDTDKMITPKGVMSSNFSSRFEEMEGLVSTNTPIFKLVDEYGK